MRFQADRAITGMSQDKLNRMTFAKYLARCMLDHHDPESLVIGLYGSWGVGKTSIINMMFEELNFALTNLEDDEKPIILNFSVWSYSGQNQLIYSFFRRLSATIRSVDYLKERERIVELLELYISFFTHTPIPKPFRKKRSFLDKLFKKEDERHGWETGRDLTHVKAELNEVLRHQKHKFIILIDNISRLYPDEIKQIFQIVKSIGDYAHTVYLLALDKNHTIHALDQLDLGSGKEYIEKVIQLPFEIPPISPHDMDTLVHSRLKDIVLLATTETNWNAEYWTDLYYSSLKIMFKSVRDVTRYCNILNFSYIRLKDVVNPVDFFALTAIEVFEPEIYAGISENKDLFTDLLSKVYTLDVKRVKNDLARCEEILARNKEIPKDNLFNLLIRLFPRIRKLYYPERVLYHSESLARQENRLCDSDSFDNYFRLSMRSGQIPLSEFSTLMDLAKEPTIFDEALTRLNKDEKILRFLNMLDDEKNIRDLSCQQIQSLIFGLLNNGDLFQNDPDTQISIDTPKRIHRIINLLLEKIPTQKERFDIIKNSAKQLSKSIYTVVNELYENRMQHDDKNHAYLPQEFRNLSVEELVELSKIVVEKIKIWAENNSLADHPRLFEVLKAWHEFGDAEEVKKYMLNLENTDKGLITLLKIGFQKPIKDAMQAYEKKDYWQDYLLAFSELLDPKLIEDHARVLFEDEYFDKLREEEQLALIIFLDLMQTKTNKQIRQASPD